MTEEGRKLEDEYIQKLERRVKKDEKQIAQSSKKRLAKNGASNRT